MKISNSETKWCMALIAMAFAGLGVSSALAASGMKEVASGMVHIPGGTNKGNDPDFGSYSLTVEDFYMDKTEVTFALWLEVYEWAVNHGYGFEHEGSGKGPSHPVHTLTWHDCVKWCNARSEMEGRGPAYWVNGAVYRSGTATPSVNPDGGGYRLPTKKEWEYAARGGNQGLRFPWGNTISPSMANYYLNSTISYDTSSTMGYHPNYNDGTYPYTSPVGSFPANGYGLYDMVGNVWEWTSNPDGTRGTVRGGSWGRNASHCQCGNDEGDGDSSCHYFGFRTVRSPSKWNGSLTLVAESADWTEGSITLCCTDADTSGCQHSYTLSYYDESKNDWVEVDTAKYQPAGADGKVHLKDKGFSSRLGGISPVKYRVKDETTGRVSEGCVTRTRYGLCVGLGSYDPKLIARYRNNGYEPPKELLQFRHDAELASEVLTQYGGAVDRKNMVLLTDSGAKISDIKREWKSLAEGKVKAGDVVFFFISTHGALSGHMLAYDGAYTREAFQRDLEPFRTGNGSSTKVIVILMSCHSEAMTSAEQNIMSEYGNVCTANILYLTVAAANESGWTMPVHSQFGEFLFNKGLKLRQADARKTLEHVDGAFGDGDGRIDMLECAKYAGALTVGMSDKSPTHVQYDRGKAGIMSDTVIVAYNAPVAVAQTVTSPPKSKACVTSRGVWVLWDNADGADYYIVRYKKTEEASFTHWKYTLGYEKDYSTAIEFISGVIDFSFWDNGYLFKTVDYASSEDRQQYVPLENGTGYSFEIIAVNAAGKSAPVRIADVETSAAAQPVTYTVLFDANGGTVSPVSREVQEGSAIGALPIPFKVKGDFLGWYTAIKEGTLILEGTSVIDDVIYYAHWAESNEAEKVSSEWLQCYPSILTVSRGDIATAASMTAANGCRTVGECYALGINPEDPEDDLRITDYAVLDGKPVLTLNHTEDGAGKSFAAQVRTFGSAGLGDAEEWEDVTDMAEPWAEGYRFFRAEVEIP